MAALTDNEKYSRLIINTLRDRFSQAFGDREPEDGVFTIVAVGSIGRREASSESDLDIYVIHDDLGEDVAQRITDEVNEIAFDVVDRRPADDGAFAHAQNLKEILGNIGGMDDSNENTTRRVLFLLESACAYNDRFYDDIFDKLAHKYLKEDLGQDQIAMFFLNDVIRYYRTICVDFEYKTGEKGKEWGLRNIKLVFSRQLIYLGGIIVAAEMCGLELEEKRTRFEQLLKMPPLHRIKDVCDATTAALLRHEYEEFLGWVSDPELRKHLKNVTPERKDDNQFRTCKDKGHAFSELLVTLLGRTYPKDHPIHRALIV